MFLLLLAADTEPNVPWWISTILVPVAIVLLTSVLSIVGVQWRISKTEWYRRLSRWEPYGERLWAIQRELYAEVCHAATEAVLAVQQFVWNWSKGEPEHNKPLLEEWSAKKEALASLDAQRAILLSSNFNDTYQELAKILFMFATHSREDVESYDQSYEWSDQLLDLRVELIDVARQSLGIDRLNKKAREAIRGEVKGKEEDVHEGATE